MMKNFNRFALFCLVLLVTVGFMLAKESEIVKKTFPAKELIKIETVSGDCIIETVGGDKIFVELEYSVTPKKAFEPSFREKSGSLKISEKWSGSSSGNVTWRLNVPENTNIEFETASGDLTVSGINGKLEASTASGEVTVENLNGDVKINTASGDVELTDVKGDIDINAASGDVDAENLSGLIEINTASGEIEVENASGEFDLGCASGDIEAEKIVIKDESSFSTASGKIKIKLGETPAHDLEFSSASGNVTVDYDGNDLRGYFELTAKKSRGRISSTVDFDNETEYEKHGKTYLKKTFTKGSALPKIKISTASGNVSLKE